MLQINAIRENPEKIIELLAVKNFDAKEIVNNIIIKDSQKRALQKKSDDTQSEANKLSKEIGALFQVGKIAEANELKAKTTDLKNMVKDINDELNRIEDDLFNLIVTLPNAPHVSVKRGKTHEDNEIVYNEGVAERNENLFCHWDLALKYNIIDFELGNKITGAGFPVYKGKGARLQRALINFFIDKGLEAGYTEIQPPLFVNEASAYGTGQLPDKDGQMYYINLDNFYLIPTAEVPVTNLYRDNILKVSDLPVKNVAYSSCFRREAGSYGKDVRGLNRLHQFDKVEIVQIQTPEKSYEALEEMRAHVASLVRLLGLPFRILRLCGGDMSFTSALTYDFEVYSKGQDKWLEVSSVSNFETFQSNRMKIRFKDENGKSVLVHTLNGSALALPRIVAALLENNQTPEGIKIPDCLIKYTGFDILN